MYEAKTKPTVASVAAYLDAIEDERRRMDCKELAELMERVSGCAPAMWGTSIVGFDRYHYRYDSGHEGDSCIVGFSSRKSEISLYFVSGLNGIEDMLAQLGKHKVGKACLYIRRLSDIQLPILERIIERSLTETKRRFPRAEV